MEDFGELPDQKYQMTITSGKGKKKSTTTMKVDYAKEGSDAPKNVELTQSKKEAKASAKAAVKTANELFTDKILEYQKKYGEGEAVEVAQSTYGAQGVAFAKLVDFDGDGQDELLIEYSDEPLFNANGATAAKAEVWAYRDGKIEKVYEPDIWVDVMCDICMTGRRSTSKRFQLGWTNLVMAMSANSMPTMVRRLAPLSVRRR